jgi:hypothetical protein
MSAPRSKVPITADSSPGWGEPSTNDQRPWSIQAGMLQPIEMTFWQISCGVSSKVAKTTLSPASTPATRNWVAKMVLPLPAVPVIRVARPRGKPPMAIASNPGMPVASFSRGVTRKVMMRSAAG